jgi:hypothetical protein
MTDVSWPSEIPKSKIIVLFLFNGTIIDKNPLAFVRDFSLIASFFCLNRPVFVKIITFIYYNELFGLRSDDGSYNCTRTGS